MIIHLTDVAINNEKLSMDIFLDCTVNHSGLCDFNSQAMFKSGIVNLFIANIHFCILFNIIILYNFIQCRCVNCAFSCLKYPYWVKSGQEDDEKPKGIVEVCTKTDV